MKTSIFDQIFDEEKGYNAGSSHAITGFKLVTKSKVPQNVIEMREKSFDPTTEIEKEVLSVMAALGKLTEYKSTVFITLWHEGYVPTSIEVYFWEEHEMDDRYGDTKLYADLDTTTGEVSGNIPGVETLDAYLRLCYIARQAGEVVRDDC